MNLAPLPIGSEHLAVATRADASPCCESDAIGNETHRAVTKQQIDAARMIAFRAHMAGDGCTYDAIVEPLVVRCDRVVVKRGPKKCASEVLAASVRKRRARTRCITTCRQGRIDASHVLHQVLVVWTTAVTGTTKYF